MKNALWYAQVRPGIVHVPIPMTTALVLTVVLMALVMVVSVNVMLVSRPFSLVTLVTIVSLTLVEKSRRPLQPLQQPQQRQLRQRLHLPQQRNAFQTVIWTALVSLVWLFVAQLIVAAVEVVDSLPALT